ncbi:unnamed protein product [Rotaria sordida]|nr:unnamed protein product [Rotaria sordida]CAF1405741.1 unnamed protein product [Rotaria sordida]
MMTAYALARICQELFGDVEYAAINTDRNKYPISCGRVVFMNIHSYYAPVTANYLMIECDKFCKIQTDPYLSDSVPCVGTNGQQYPNMGQFFCCSVKCMKYYCVTCWDLNPNHAITQINTNNKTIECELLALIHKPLIRNARTPEV